MPTSCFNPQIGLRSLPTSSPGWEMRTNGRFNPQIGLRSLPTGHTLQLLVNAVSCFNPQIGLRSLPTGMGLWMTDNASNCFNPQIGLRSLPTGDNDIAGKALFVSIPKSGLGAFRR